SVSAPWNFPLAIFLGQVSAALAAGNTVVAKPAEQTSIIGYRAVQLAHQAGIPTDVLQYLPGTGATVGNALTADERIGGVCFTGSTGTAKLINRTLANREGAIIPLIAETGGQNAMVVDSTSQPEQVVNDVVSSSFTSAGQRCSALRVLFLQEDIADRVIDVLQGAMDELVIGNPS
ncbi:aldehyde dehydrogenase family protein, partial [Shewanella sp. POL2]|uniref:aldehyde dehydrogenase family protein n=1 Tax=Shewanella sp. POL2 TaxID=1201295 RepID=UPI0012F6A870